MNKLRQRLSRLRSVVSIKTYKRPMLFVIAMMVLLNLIILAVAAWIAWAIDPGFSSFIDAFANGSLKWMLTPNAILEVDEPATLVLAVVVLVIGMILFTGTIIALTTNMIKDYFQSRKDGSGKLYLSGHIVILNWNNKVPELVADLMHIEGVEVTVAILADIAKSDAEKRIQNAIAKTAGHTALIENMNVLVKQGDPLSQSDLDAICITEAVSVMVMNQDDNARLETGLSASDLNVIKIVLSVGRLPYKTSPPIVAEIMDIKTKDKILMMSRVVTTLQDHTILPICFDRRLGQIIAQTIVHNAMEDVYLSMFSFAGSEVYHLANTTFEDCLLHHTDALPLACKDGGLFVLSRDDRAIHRRTTASVAAVPLRTRSYREATSMNVYVLGTNNKLPFIRESFAAYESLYQTTFQASWVPDAELGDLIRALNDGDEPATVLLLSEDVARPEAIDANVIDQLIRLEAELTREDVNIIVELLDPKNDEIIKDFDINNTIISNKIVSLLLSKLALYPKTASFYENLLTLSVDENEENVQEVFIRRANELLDEEFPLVFDSKKAFVLSFHEAFHRTILPFGRIREGNLQLFSDDLHDLPCTIEASDSIVLMKL